MDLLPPIAKLLHEPIQPLRDTAEFDPSKSVVLTEDHWSGRTVQLENSLTTVADHVHMRWTMVIRINDHS